MLGEIAYHTMPDVRTTVTANQARVLGIEPTSRLAASAAREAFDLYARYWYDTFHLRSLSPAELDERTEVEGTDHIDLALEAGRGCIAALPHMGNWDVAGHWMAVNGYRLAAVAEELKPLRLFELFLRHREELGLKIIPLSGENNIGQRLAALLSDNWIVALVADRDLSGRGIEVEMFGAPRRLPAGPALLSITTGAPLLVCSVCTTDRGWQIRIGEPLVLERTGNTRADVAELTRRMAAQFERGIAAHPADWHLFQPGWEA